VKTNWAEIIRGLCSGEKFNKFFSGVDFKLPNGKSIQIKVESTFRRKNVIGLRLSKHSFITKAKSSEGIEGIGFGEDENKLISIQKSIAESLERVVYKSSKNLLNLNTSNGWAVHLTAEKAQKSALNELLERDAILVHWLTKASLNEISPETYPKWLKIWKNKELVYSKNYNQLKILITTKGYLPVVQVMILNQNGRSFISQGTSTNLDIAIYRALAETTRIASEAISAKDDGRTISSITTPWDHALAYTQFDLPKWIFGSEISYHSAKYIFTQSEKKINLQRINPKFKTEAYGDLYVSHCTSKSVQPLYFGETDLALTKGLINFERLEEVNPNFVLNPLPHCVP
jgi:hypothetical protein